MDDITQQAFDRYHRENERLRRRMSRAYIALFAVAALVTAPLNAWFAIVYAFMAGWVLGRMQGERHGVSS